MKIFTFNENFKLLIIRTLTTKNLNFLNNFQKEIIIFFFNENSHHRLWRQWTTDIRYYQKLKWFSKRLWKFYHFSMKLTSREDTTRVYGTVDGVEVQMWPSDKSTPVYVHFGHFEVDAGLCSGVCDHVQVAFILDVEMVKLKPCFIITSCITSHKQVQLCKANHIFLRISFGFLWIYFEFFICELFGFFFSVLLHIKPDICFWFFFLSVFSF